MTFKEVEETDGGGNRMNENPKKPLTVRQFTDLEMAVFYEKKSSKLETELADKNKQLAEARAEIERLERREYQLKKDNIESLDLLAADTALQNRLADQIESKDKQIIEERAEIERLKHIKRCLREEFLLNTQNYPKEYHALFQRKFKAALSAAERGGK